MKRFPNAPAAGEDEESVDSHAGALARGWRLLPRALHYLRPNRSLAAGSIGLTILLAIVTLAEPWPLAFIVDTVLEGRKVLALTVLGPAAAAVGTLFIAGELVRRLVLTPRRARGHILSAGTQQ